MINYNDARFQVTTCTITNRRYFNEVNTEAELKKLLKKIKADRGMQAQWITIRDTQTGAYPSYTNKNGRWYLDK